MKINHEIEIDRPIDQVWDVLANQFADAYKWIASVPKSYELKEEAIDGAPVAGRMCELSAKGPDGLVAHEIITVFDADNYRLQLRATPQNTPSGFPVKHNLLTYQLRPLGDTRTLVSLEAQPQTRFTGKILFPLVKVGLSKAFANLNKQLKAHVEGGPTGSGENIDTTIEVTA